MKARATERLTRQKTHKAQQRPPTALPTVPQSNRPTRLKATSLTTAANLLNNYENNDSFSKGDRFDAIKIYAGSQYKDGHPWLAEDIDPLTGEWIVDLPRGFHYNHSTFNDLIITGLVGIRADNEDDLVINPLLDEGDLSHFALENVLFRGYNLTVIYDTDGSHYGQGAGMRVYLDGELAAEADGLGSLTVKLR